MIAALGKLGDTRAVDDLRRVASSDPVASLRAQAARAADRIEASGEELSKQQELQADIKSLTEKIEMLEAQLKELRKKVPESDSTGALTRNPPGGLPVAEAPIAP